MSAIQKFHCLLIHVRLVTSPLLRRPYSLFRLLSKLTCCSSDCLKACRTRLCSISRFTIGEKGSSLPVGLDTLPDDILVFTSLTSSASSSESPGGSLAREAALDPPEAKVECRLMDLLLVLVLLPADYTSSGSQEVDISTLYPALRTNSRACTRTPVMWRHWALSRRVSTQCGSSQQEYANQSMIELTTTSRVLGLQNPVYIPWYMLGDRMRTA